MNQYIKGSKSQQNSCDFYIRLLALLIFCSSYVVSYAVSFMPVVTNYTPKDYQAGLQNWAIAQGTNGEIYVGNNTGLLSFDGYTWNNYSMQGNQIVRSILVDDDRIYVGTYEDFGYFTRNSSGKLDYTSLWNQLNNAGTHNDEIWNILKVDNNIYFQSFSSWFKYDGKTVTPHYNPHLLPLYFHKANGNIYVQMINGGLYLLENDQYKLLISKESLYDDSVVAIIPLANGKMILCTEWHGLFDYDGKVLTPRKTNIDGELKSSQINRATFVPSDSTIVIGTIRDGIYAVNLKGEEKWHYDVNNGLYNNSVLRLFCDRNNNVWAGLDIGISLIHSGSPYSILAPDRNSQLFGMVYGLNVANDNLYIASNQSAWVYSFANKSILPIRGTEGQNWHISTFDSQILLGNNFGTKIIYGNVARDIPETETSSTCLRKSIVNGQEVLIESSYYNIRIYRKVNGEWHYSNAVEGFSSPIRQFEIDHAGTIWAAHMSLGMYRIELSGDLKHVEKYTYIKSLSGNEDDASQMHVMKIRGRVVLSDSKKTYTYDDINKRIVPFTQLNMILTNGIHTAVAVDDNSYWLADDKGYTLIKYDNDNYKLERFVPASFFGLECNENNNNVYVDGNTTYFCLNNGIGRLDMSTNKGKAPIKSKLYIVEVTSLSQDNKLWHLPVVSNKESNTKTPGDITFRLSYPNYDNEPLRFNYQLTGSGLDLKSESNEPSITYSSLGYGDYHFIAYVKNVDGENLGTVEYYFSKPHPFYLSIYAWIFYFLLIGVLIYLYTRWHLARLLEKRTKEFDEQKIKQNFKMLEQEHTIAQQREQLLEAEIQMKSKELISLALDAAGQYNVVENLKGLMVEQERKGAISQRDMESVLKQISGSVKDEDFWKIYQQNFDLIHKNFFRNLRKKYPELTASDLRFCALLRLNLSTKDIAEFTNLTIRGVETARYRLRKKFSIPEGTGLVDFLIDFT